MKVYSRAPTVFRKKLLVEISSRHDLSLSNHFALL